MDAKANTLVCDSPVVPSQSDAGMVSPDSAFLIVVAGGIPGTMLRVDRERVLLGRSTEDTYQFNDITVSRAHASVWVDGQGSVFMEDEGSTNGTYLNGRRVTAQRAKELYDGDRIQLGQGVVLKLVRLDPSDEHFQREMYERTVRDTLTGLYNRSYFLSQIKALSARSLSQGVGLAIMMIDVDHFKRVNDRLGHAAGDMVLRQVSAVIRESTRAEDLVARYGGEEFVAALPISVSELAAERAERIRSSLAGRWIAVESEKLRVTVSIGLAFGPPGRCASELSLLLTADQALYQAKADGRNRVVFGSHTPSSPFHETQSAEFSSVVL